MDRRQFLTVLGTGGVAASGAGAGCLTLYRKYGATPLKSTSRNPSHPRLVLLYAPCTVSTRFINPFNPSIAFTPHLKRLARGSAVFTNNFVETGQSGISYASMFTGAHANEHGVYWQPEHISPAPLQISQAFAQNGYDTFYFNGHSMASFDMGYGKSSRHVQKCLLTPNHWLFEKLLDKLGRDKNYRAFVMTNFTITHAPYVNRMSLEHRIKCFLSMPGVDFAQELPGELDAAGLTREQADEFYKVYSGDNPEYLMLQWDYPAYVKKLKYSPEKLEKFLKATTYFYKLNMSRLDTLFGAVLERIRNRGLMDHSVVAFTADHGEIMHRDNAFFSFTHGMQQAPEVLNSPLIIYAPVAGARPGTHRFNTGSVDIFPTLAGLCSLDMPAGAAPRGADLSATIRGSAAPPEKIVFSHELIRIKKLSESLTRYKIFNTLHPALDHPSTLWASARKGDLTFKICKTSIGSRKLETVAYNSSKDPEERRNIFDSVDPVHRDMEIKLMEYMQLLKKGFFEWRKKTTGNMSDQEKMKKLKDLGYIK